MRELYFVLLLECVGFFVLFENCKCKHWALTSPRTARELCGERHVEAYLRLCSGLVQMLLLGEVNGKLLISDFQTRQFVFSVSYQETLKPDPTQRKWFQPVLWLTPFIPLENGGFKPLQKIVWPQNTFLYVVQKTN